MPEQEVWGLVRSLSKGRKDEEKDLAWRYKKRGRTGKLILRNQRGRRDKEENCMATIRNRHVGGFIVLRKKEKDQDAFQSTDSAHPIRGICTL